MCQTCKNNPRKQPITADKNLETDDIITTRYDDKHFLSNSATTSKREPFLPQSFGSKTDSAISNSTHIDFLEQKRIADTLDKMCPMCGKMYTNSTTFDDFQEHVESHFIDDSDLDVSLEKNYEFISHTVGNF